MNGSEEGGAMGGGGGAVGGRDFLAVFQYAGGWSPTGRFLFQYISVPQPT